jgi:hypothetical protein
MEKIIVDLTVEEIVVDLTDEDLCLDLPVLDSDSEEEDDLLELLDCVSPIASPTLVDSDSEEDDLLELLDCVSPIASPIASPVKRKISSDFWSDEEVDSPMKMTKLAYDSSDNDSDDDSINFDNAFFTDFDLEVTYDGPMDIEMVNNVRSNSIAPEYWRRDAMYAHPDTRLTTFEVCVWPFEYDGVDWQQVDVYCYDLEGDESYSFHVDLRCLRNTHYLKSDLVDYLATEVMFMVREKSAKLSGQYRAPFRHVVDLLCFDYTKHSCSPATATVLLNRDLAMFLDSFN